MFKFDLFLGSLNVYMDFFIIFKKTVMAFICVSILKEWVSASSVFISTKKIN